MRIACVRTGMVRAAIVAALCGLALGAASASASAAGFGVAKFEAGTCTSNTPECTYATTGQFYTQAAGHPNFGITDFSFNTNELLPGVHVPAGNVKNLRVDLPAGLSVNPQALPECSMEEFGEHELVAHTGFYPASTCSSETVVGRNVLTVLLEVAPLSFVKVPLEGKVYNLSQPEHVPAEFGVAIGATSIAESLLKVSLPGGAYIHVLLQGGVSWHSETLAEGKPLSPSGDYHEFFKIDNISNALPLLESRLEFNGKAGTGFLTMPSECGPAVTKLWVESYEGETEATETEPPAEVSGCASVPFKPEVKVEPGTTQSDQPDGATVKVLVPQSSDPEAVNSSALKDAEVTLPEGMTLNPAAADGLQACTDQQFGKEPGKPIASEAPAKCPAESQIGTVAIETPTLPKGALTGGVYVGQPEAGKSPGSGGEYRIFIDAESVRYGVSVRLEGRVKANEGTGRLTTLVTENPQIPFSEFILKLSNGAHTPLANPLTCGTAATTASFIPFSAPGVAQPGSSSFTVDTNGNGGACASPLPFTLTQATSALPTTGGSNTSFTFKLERGDGQQYLGKVSAMLPEGMVALIPSVTLCGNAEAGSNSCPAASEIGTASVKLGSGGSPYPLSGTVYLTGPYDGAPYGLAVVVPAEHVGPYDYGIITTRAAINIDPYTARVTVSATLPTIEGGVPLRLRDLTIAITHAGFMLNPTSCASLTTNTLLTSTGGATQSVSTPFQATGCGSLPFKPTFKAYSGAYTSRNMGASLKVDITQGAHQANIKSVVTTLPSRLPARESTLKQACAEATFAANPYSCPAGSRVGGATVHTPTLPGALTGPVYIVSHGGAAYPDLDIVLKGDGVTVILVGHTNIRKGITHSKFLAVPDVPISSFELKLPIGSHSILAAAGSLCRKPMFMPTTITAQNGVKVTQKTRVQVLKCPVLVLGKKVRRSSATLTVKTHSAGEVTATGRLLRRTVKKVRGAGSTKIQLRLTRRGLTELKRRHRLRVDVHLRFVPSNKHHRATKASVAVVFRSPARATLRFRGRG